MMEKGQFSEAEQVLAYLKTIAPPSLVQALALQMAMETQKWEEALQMALKFWADTGGAVPETESGAVADALVLAFPPLETVASRLPEPLNLELPAILNALQCVSEERYEAAQESLKPLPRNSIFADWKWLIKGWIAFYQGDKAKAEALFGCLRQDGGPLRAAAPYRALIGPCGEMQESTARQMGHLFGFPALGDGPGPGAILME